MKRLRILLAITALTLGTSAFAGAQEFHNQKSDYKDRDQHVSRDRGNGVEYKYPVYDKDDRGRDRDDRWKVKDVKVENERGRHQYGDRR